MPKLKEREKLTESARLLRARLSELERDKSEERKPFNQVAIQSIKDALTAIGRKLSKDWLVI